MAIITLTPVTPGEVASELAQRGYRIAPDTIHVPVIHTPDDGHVPQIPHEVPFVPPQVPPDDIPDPHPLPIPPLPPFVKPDDGVHLPPIHYQPRPDPLPPFDVPEEHIPFHLHIPVEAVLEEPTWMKFLRVLPYFVALIKEKHILDVRRLV